MHKTLFLLAVTLLAAGASQAAEIEITPFIGYRWGGEIDRNTTSLFAEDVDVDADAVYGLILGVRPVSGLLIELLVDRQETEFVREGELFGPPTELFDVEITYIHVGAGWTWGRGDWEGFLLGTIGVGHVNPDSPGASSEDELSASFGGGLKVFANRHLGFRLEVRGFWTDIASGEHILDNPGDDLYQGEVKLGVVVRF